MENLDDRTVELRLSPEQYEEMRQNPLDFVRNLLGLDHKVKGIKILRKSLDARKKNIHYIKIVST